MNSEIKQLMISIASMEHQQPFKGSPETVNMTQRSLRNLRRKLRRLNNARKEHLYEQSLLKNQKSQELDLSSEEDNFLAISKELRTTTNNKCPASFDADELTELLEDLEECSTSENPSPQTSPVRPPPKKQKHFQNIEHYFAEPEALFNLMEGNQLKEIMTMIKILCLAKPQLKN